MVQRQDGMMGRKSGCLLASAQTRSIVKVSASNAQQIWYHRAHLRGHIVQSASTGDWSLSTCINGQPEICQLDHFMLSKQDVLRLDVSMDHSLQHHTC